MKLPQRQNTRGDDPFILETFTVEKGINLSETDRSFDKEKEMLKEVSVIKEKENADDKENNEGYG